MNIPIYPAYNVQVLEDDKWSLVTDTILVRLTTRVPHEMWEEFSARLGLDNGHAVLIKKELN